MEGNGGSGHSELVVLLGGEQLQSESILNEGRNAMTRRTSEGLGSCTSS